MTSSPRHVSDDLKALSALAMASHEVRGALAAIISHAELLAERGADPHESRATALLIERHGRAALDTFDTILKAARDQDAPAGVGSGPCDLRAMIEELVLLQTPRAVAAGLRLEASIDANLPCQLALDGRALHRILSNLIENALKFTTDGNIRIRALLTASGDLAIEVKDTGIGVHPSNTQRIFEPYVRLCDSRRSGMSGIGLGLSLCRDLARAMDAELMVEHRKGGGSIFRLLISGRSWRGHSNDAFDGIRILLVDDCHETTRMLSAILESKGAFVTSISDIRDLTSRISVGSSTSRFDLILLDLEMPDHDGWEVQAALRRSGCRIPVVALTAHDVVALKSRAFQKGFSGILGKPLLLSRLADLIEECVVRDSARLAG
jgi:CheY-like chemotaxis protein/anti-sigma regulatory factor (Ser/Thr protein kinase)